jgi:hypothetical protein
MNGGWILALVMSGLALGNGPSDEQAKEDYVASIRRMEQVVSSLNDVTYTMHKMEVVRGKMVESAPSLVKFQAPMSVYLRIGEADSPDQEVLYRDGWNSGKLKVSLGGWIPTLNLHPDSKLVMRKNRHSIRFLAPQLLVARIAEDVNRSEGRDDVHVIDRGQQYRLGEDAHCFELSLPKGEVPEFYADVVEMCISERTGLLVTLKAWEYMDDALVLVEDYGYEGVQANTGLSSIDFNPDNQAYNF